ncbi:MAG: hypothetical protein V4691_09480 [Pseudomonadota bacterium]
MSVITQFSPYTPAINPWLNPCFTLPNYQNNFFPNIPVQNNVWQSPQWQPWNFYRPTWPVFPTMPWWMQRWPQVPTYPTIPTTPTPVNQEAIRRQLTGKDVGDRYGSRYGTASYDLKGLGYTFDREVQPPPYTNDYPTSWIFKNATGQTISLSFGGVVGGTTVNGVNFGTPAVTNNGTLPAELQAIDRMPFTEPLQDVMYAKGYILAGKSAAGNPVYTRRFRADSTSLPPQPVYFEFTPTNGGINPNYHAYSIKAADAPSSLASLPDQLENLKFANAKALLKDMGFGEPVVIQQPVDPIGGSAAVYRFTSLANSSRAIDVRVNVGGVMMGGWSGYVASATEKTA